jgi:hypothetical protein
MMLSRGDRSLPKSAPAGGEYYVFRDAIHNLIEIDDPIEGRYLRAVLGTREMQRLRRIRQNGLPLGLGWQQASRRCQCPPEE